MIRENGLHRIHRDIAPVFLDEIAHSVASGAGVGETIGFAGCKLRGEIVVGVNNRIGMCIGKLHHTFGADFEIGNLPIAKTKNHIASRTGGMLSENLKTGIQVPLLQHNAFERIVRQTHLPGTIVKRIGKMSQTVLVHSRITQLSSKSKKQCPGTTIRRTDVQENGDIGVFDREILILTGQGIPIGSRRASKCESRATFGRNTGGFAPRLTQERFVKRNTRTICKPVNFFHERRA